MKVIMRSLLRVNKMDYAIFFFLVVAYFIGRNQVEAYKNAKKSGGKCEVIVEISSIKN